jgi:hypothetical protein
MDDSIKCRFCILHQEGLVGNQCFCLLHLYNTPLQGILSTDLYKLYINPLLDRLETSGLGLKIGNISVSNTACADDIALISEIPDEAQTLVNMATDFAFMEGYQLLAHIVRQVVCRSCTGEA